ncbi:DUF72 domain-containing protein [Pseudomonas sp. TWP3-1]|uniref:DUF72 domain-containing protein n=1 Tax=Pseudomonas sp. TWP3-1 TaxID=2804631 RepID=UPI003CE928FC
MFIGCAGWSLGREYWPDFPTEGTHLQRYAARVNCAEINSSFYGPHRRQTYERWAESVPPNFRFSVKLPKLITHELQLQHCDQALDEFLQQSSGLQEKLGCLLIQLPPKLAFEAPQADAFFSELRERFNGDVVLEPRHESWTTAHDLLIEHRIAQAAVDPSRISTDATPQGWPGVHYWRLHGSPRIYHSAYDPTFLQQLATQIQKDNTWCIFDNTASGAALGNALSLVTCCESRP